MNFKTVSQYKAGLKTETLVRFSWNAATDDGKEPKVEAAQFIVRLGEPLPQAEGAKDSKVAVMDIILCRQFRRTVNDNVFYPAYYEIAGPRLGQLASVRTLAIMANPLPSVKIAVLDVPVKFQFVADPAKVCFRPKRVKGCVVDVVEDTGYMFRTFNPDPGFFKRPSDQPAGVPNNMLSAFTPGPELAVPEFYDWSAFQHDIRKASQTPRLADLANEINGWESLLTEDNDTTREFFHLLAREVKAPSKDTNSAQANTNATREWKRLLLYDAFPSLIPKWPQYFDLFIRGDAPDKQTKDTVYDLEYSLGEGHCQEAKPLPPIFPLGSLTAPALTNLAIVSPAVCNWSGWSLAVQNPWDASGIRQPDYPPGSLVERLKSLIKAGAPLKSCGDLLSQESTNALTDKSNLSEAARSIEQDLNAFISERPNDRTDRIKLALFSLTGSFSERTSHASVSGKIARRYMVDDLLDWLSDVCSQADDGSELPKSGRLHLAAVGGFPPSSLPALRYGHRYQMRIGSIGVTGQSPSLQEPDFAPEFASEIQYLRHDPIAAPMVYALNVDEHGLRYRPGDAQPIQSLGFGSISNGDHFELDPQFSSVKEIRVLPPEIHRSEEPLLVHGILSVNQPDEFQKLALANDAVKLPALLKDGRLAPVGIFRDPLALRCCAMLTGTRSLPVLTADFQTEEWPMVRPMFITVRAVADGELRLEHLERPGFGTGFLIEIPPGEVCDLALSATVLPEKYPQLGISQLLRESMGNVAEDEVKQAVLLGQHPLVSGKNTIRLTHAVNRPRTSPNFLPNGLAEDPIRLPGAKAAKIICRLQYDPATTGQIILKSQWPVYSDDPSQPAPLVPLVEIRKSFDPFLEGWDAGKMQEFLNFLETATSSSLEPYFASSYDDLSLRDIEFLKHIAACYNAQSFQKMVVAMVVTGKTFARPNPGVAASPAIHDFVQTFDDTKFHPIDYTPSAATCFEKYFVQNRAAEGTPGRLAIRATTPPAVPEVAFVLPLFGWRADTVRMTSHRQGFAVRIFLRRPWFSSGPEEKLGVIFPRKDSLPPDPAIHPYITQLGFDPVWDLPDWVKNGDRWFWLGDKHVAFAAKKSESEKSSLPAAKPAWILDGDQFPTEGFAESSVPLPLPLPINNGLDQATQPANPEIQAVVHPVRYSPSRGLWYCDVVFKDCEHLNSPFLRLAVARYQATAIQGAHLSPVVQLDFIPLANSRSATVVARGNRIFKVSVAGVFPEPKGPPMPEVHVEVSLVGTDAEVDGREYWDGNLLVPSASDMGDNPETAVTKKLHDPHDAPIIGPVSLTRTGDSLYEAEIIVPPAFDSKARRFLRITETRRYKEPCAKPEDSTHDSMPYAVHIPLNA